MWGVLQKWTQLWSGCMVYAAARSLAARGGGAEVSPLLADSIFLKTIVLPYLPDQAQGKLAVLPRQGLISHHAINSAVPPLAAALHAYHKSANRFRRG